VPTEVHKLKGTLLLGSAPPAGVQAEAQVSHIGVPQTVTRDSPLTVLTGDVVQSSATYSWQLTGQIVLDYSDPAGVFYWAHDNQGTEQPFSFTPSGAAGPTITGTCVVDGWNMEELAAGSLVISKFTWPVQGQITITAPTTGLTVRGDVVAA
jgi:hypothetical protein